MSSVIVDEFEVVAATQAAPGDAPPPVPQTPPAPSGPTPEDVRHIIRTRERQQARHFAH